MEARLLDSFPTYRDGRVCTKISRHHSYLQRYCDPMIPDIRGFAWSETRSSSLFAIAGQKPRASSFCCSFESGTTGISRLPRIEIIAGYVLCLSKGMIDRSSPWKYITIRLPVHRYRTDIFPRAVSKSAGISRVSDCVSVYETKRFHLEPTERSKWNNVQTDRQEPGTPQRAEITNSAPSS